MRRIQYHAYGGPEIMKLEDVAPQPPGSGEVAVKVSFAAINPIDWKVRNGDLKMITGKVFPRAIGSDFSGIVTAVGAGVTRFKPGDAVFGLARLKQSGALGEAVVTGESCLAKKPDSVSFADAACLGTPGVTAWNGLVDKADLRRGQSVFINGCTGAVGAAAVQIARMLGATVAGSCGADAMPRARDLGVQKVFDYRKTDLSTLSDRFDVVYDTAAIMPTALGLRLAGRNGVFADINPTPIKFLRSLMNRRLKPVVCTPRADILDRVADAAGAGKLRLPVAETVPLGGAIALLTALEGGRKIGGKGLVAIG